MAFPRFFTCSSLAAVLLFAAVDAAADDSLTWNGVTFYGKVDVGYAHQSRGVPYDPKYYTGLETVILKNSNRSVNSWSNNGLSQSMIGLKGDIALNEEFAGIFKLETAFNPLSMRRANTLQSLVSNNGVPLANQTANADSSRAGQIFNNAAYVGFSSKVYGTLTYGRQNGLLTDNVIAYDPNAGSYAFSLIGFSGTTAGVGNTQDARLNSSLKYTGRIGQFRIGAQYQFAGMQGQLIGSDGYSGSAAEIDVGGDYANLSADLIYSRKNGAIAASALSAAQMLTLPANSLAATVSDNSSYALMAKYTAGAARIFAGYERIQYANPSSPLPAGTYDLGGYVLSAVNNGAYITDKILHVYWGGLKYSVNSELDLTGAYYGYSQNQYVGATACTGGSSSPTCRGTLDAVSFVATYKLMTHLDLYGGTMWSNVHNGLSSGYLNSSTASTMIGGRFTF